ncbi:MAG: TIGR03084 family metal-binding protein [Steroidobacteraceae bacterium]|nr:TIGR03084 family metal-binding protein [Steroidobacteraceae bacterium]MDW8260670.1 TIGR03084 family metal-binding protein [Gammaproteobacteria bacterium]
MQQLACDFRAECVALNELLMRMDATEWRTPTQFKGWTADDIIGHLHVFDYAAQLTLSGAVAVREFFDYLQANRSPTWTLRDVTRQWLAGCAGPTLRVRWFEFAMQLAARYAALDPKMRVAWGGPSMSVRSLLSARLMETWAHGQALFDLLGAERVETDRVRSIAQLGINTFEWSFRVRGLAVPDLRPFVRLRAPSGAYWEWNSPDSPERIEGSAVDFCRVVTQTRNIADTQLNCTGAVACKWMAIAQCFAGPPEDPPAPGTRFRRVR